MSTPDYHIQLLVKGHRGGFAAKIAEAWKAADSSNQSKIEEAFRSIFTPEPLMWRDADRENAPPGIYWIRQSENSPWRLGQVWKETETFLNFHYMNGAEHYSFGSYGTIYGPLNPPTP